MTYIIQDGTGSAAQPCDIRITGDRIAAVSMLQGAQASEVIDARGLHICPGFIGMHGHSDFNLQVQPPGRGKIMRGIKTEVTGQFTCSLAACNLVRMRNLGVAASP